MQRSKPVRAATLLLTTTNSCFSEGEVASNFAPDAVLRAGNLFHSPIKSLDVGVEYRHGTRELVKSLDGKLSRLEFAAKYSF